MLRTQTGVGGVSNFPKIALRRCTSMLLAYEGVGGGPISRKKSIT